MANLSAVNRESKPWIKNTKIPLAVNQGGLIRRIVILLQGQVTIAGGTTNGTVLGLGGPVGLITRIHVKTTPSGGSRYPGGDIVDATPRALLVNSISQRNGKFISDLLAATLGNGAVGVYQVYLPIPIYFADSSQRNSLATALNADPANVSNIQVIVETGDLSTCFSGNDRTATSDFSQLSLQLIDERVDVRDANGNTIDTNVIYQESHVLSIAATNKRLLDEAMPQNGSFLSWLIMGEQSAQQNASDALLNKVVVGGATLDFEKYNNDIFESMLADEWMDPSTTATGIRFIDWTDGVLQANSIPANSLSKVYFDVNNVSGANLDQLEFFTRRVYAPAPASGS
jgi:hypothetical protein